MNRPGKKFPASSAKFPSSRVDFPPVWEGFPYVFLNFFPPNHKIFLQGASHFACFFSRPAHEHPTFCKRVGMVRAFIRGEIFSTKIWILMRKYYVFLFSLAVIFCHFSNNLVARLVSFFVWHGIEGKKKQNKTKQNKTKTKKTWKFWLLQRTI